MAVDASIHLLGLTIIIFIFVVSLQQICISSIEKEKPKSYYRILTGMMLFNEVLQHLLSSLWFESTSNDESNTIAVLLHMSRFLSAIFISCTFYPILIRTIEYFYNSREFEESLKIPKWLLSPWKYIIATVIIFCIISYIIMFSTNSLHPLWFYYMFADIVVASACFTLIAAMIDVFHKVQLTLNSLSLRLNKQQSSQSTNQQIIKQQTTETFDINNKDTKIVAVETQSTMESDQIDTQSTLQLKQAKHRMHKGKKFLFLCVFMATLLLIRTCYTFYSTVSNKQWYVDGDMNVMPYDTSFAYIGSVMFVMVYCGGLIIWLYKGSHICTKIDDEAVFNKLFKKCNKCNKCKSHNRSLKRQETGLKDEPENKKTVKKRSDVENGKNDETETMTNEIELVEDELGHAVPDEYDDETKMDLREETEILTATLNNLKQKRTGSGDHLMPQFNKRETITPNPRNSNVFSGHVNAAYSVDLDGLQMIKSKVIIYLFDLVITDSVSGLFYRKTSSQIESMKENKFYGQFGGIKRVKKIQQHIEKMGKDAILYCFARKMNASTLEAIMKRLKMLQYFDGRLPNQLIDSFNESMSLMQERGISESEKSTSPLDGRRSTKENVKIYVPSKLGLATLSEDAIHTPNIQINDNHDDDIDDINDIMNASNNSPVNDDYNNFTTSIGSLHSIDQRQDSNSPPHILKFNIYAPDNIDNDDENMKKAKEIYEHRLFGKNSDIVKEQKGNSQINMLIFKLMNFYDLLNDEILIVTPDFQTVSYFKAIGLCKGYHVNGENGLTDNDIEEIHKYL